MRHLLRICTVAAWAATGCSLPPQLVSSTESLREYSELLEESHAEDIEQYGGRIARLAIYATGSAGAGLDAHECDVRAMAGRIDELTRAYDTVSFALLEVLRAEPEATRAGLFDREEAIELAVAMVREQRRAKTAAEGRVGRLRALARRGGFAERREHMAGACEALLLENDQLARTLQHRVRTDYAQLDAGLRDLLTYFDARESNRSERKRALHGSVETSEQLDAAVADPEFLGRGAARFADFDRALLDLDRPGE